MESVTNTSVILKNSQEFTAKNVVVSCGPYTMEKFDELQQKTKVIDTETFTFDGDLSNFSLFSKYLAGLPPIFSEK